VVIVHLFGQSAHLAPLMEAAARYDVPILEDAAEALGTHYEGKQVGAFTELGVVSFNGNKIITTTGGGALISKKKEWIEKARFWSTQARDPGLSYEHSELGYNYRLSNVLAGIGRGQLEVLEDRVLARRAIAYRYREAFADIEGMELMPEAPWGRHTHWLSVFLLDPAKIPLERDAVVRALAAEDIEARPVWKPMHLQKLYASAERFGGEVAEQLYARGLCLPSTSSLTESDQGRVIDAVRRAVGARPRDC
jgi:pyridoxal phosphate-dependent aminotransferase EpsN